MTLSFADAAERVLQTQGSPLHYSEITERALVQELITSEGKTPAASMNAVLAVAIKQRGDVCRFVRTAPGFFGLRAWAKSGSVVEVETNTDGDRVRVPHYPEYAAVQAFLRVAVALPPDAITGLRSKIVSLTGTPQAQLDWRDPDVWIQERLDGSDRVLALRIWTETDHQVNPRHMLGHWLLSNRYGLLDSSSGELRITSDGQDFMASLRSETVRRIDDQEGIFGLLSIIDQEGPASRSGLSPAWREYLETVSRVRSDSYSNSTLYMRLRNLLARELVEQEGRNYKLTERGLTWLAPELPEADEETGLERIRKLNVQLRGQVRESIIETLKDIDPYAFEQLIRKLLQAMGYDDVEVTAASNDKGVDVVGNIEMGITSVREVVQVKRHQANIQRPVVDALRGSLHRFEAMQGTIITVGGFSKGTREAAFERGAAPITLIDGQKLVDLLTEHGIGVRKKVLEVWEFDEDGFADLSDAGAPEE